MNMPSVRSLVFIKGFVLPPSNTPATTDGYIITRLCPSYGLQSQADVIYLTPIMVLVRVICIDITCVSTRYLL